MPDLTHKLGEPQVIIPAFSTPILGAKVTLARTGLKLVLASYLDPSLLIYDVTFHSEKPQVELEQVISNEASAGYDGGTPTTLWPAPAPGHSVPRAASAQISDDGQTLFYLQNGGFEIGRYDVGLKSVLPSLTPLKERGEDFLLLYDGKIATIENYQNCAVRVYRTDSTLDGKLELIREIPLNASMMYGLCNVGNRTLVLACDRSNSPNGPGVYELTEENLLNEPRLVKTLDFPPLPPTSRGLTPVFHSELTGFFVTTYDFNRKSQSMGTPSSLLYVPGVS